MRRLADQTAVSTLDVDEPVRELRGAVATSVHEVDQSIAEVLRSAGDVSPVAERLLLIIAQVRAIAPGPAGG